jgi:hypothetical protein
MRSTWREFEVFASFQVGDSLSFDENPIGNCLRLRFSFQKVCKDFVCVRESTFIFLLSVFFTKLKLIY